MRTKHTQLLLFVLSIAIASCGKETNVIDNSFSPSVTPSDTPIIRLDDVAYLLSNTSLGYEQLGEVHDAVCGSTGNGYDEEYTMQDLFRDPGAGVGDHSTAARRLCVPETKSTKTYQTPLRDLLKNAVESQAATKGTRDILNGASVQAYLDALQDSDIQIYWPYADSWDWEALPIITFDPEDGSEANVGYEVVVTNDGKHATREIIVTEEIAKTRPVWVVNRNDDSDFTSLELIRKNDPAWGNNGGDIIVTPHNAITKTTDYSASPAGRVLLLKYVILKRNMDSWFAGASELCIRIGSVENFVASTEAELRLYSPQITDFMVVVKRNETYTIKNLNTVLVSSWTPQLESCGFMITEDDGGTRQTWSCSATVKVQSKSYGFDVSLPINSRDDIIWRGQLSYNYLTANNKKVSSFGDIDAVFEILDY